MDTGAHGGPDATTNRKKRNGNRPTTATIKGKNEPDNFAATSNRHSNNHESTEHQAPSTEHRLPIGRTGRSCKSFAACHRRSVGVCA